jgi:hypothetical protein
MARQESRCWRCGAAWTASPPLQRAEDLDALRARTGHVLETRAARRTASARRERLPEVPAIA